MMSSAGKSCSPGPPDRAAARTMARLAAVQALYQMELTSADVAVVAAEFIAHRMANVGEDMDLSGADQGFFRDLLFGVIERQIEVDNLIEDTLAESWTLGRLDSILRALLRAAAYELLARTDVPARVAIAQYVDVAHAFFDGEEPRFVNGVLDGIARRLRPSELTAGRGR